MGVIIEPAATALLPDNSMLLAAPTTGMKFILAAAGAMPLPTDLVDAPVITTITEAASASLTVADLSTTTTTLVLHSTSASNTTTATTVPPPVLLADLEPVIVATTTLHPLLVPLHTKIRESPELTWEQGWGVYMLVFKLMVLQVPLACLAYIMSPVDFGTQFMLLWFGASHILHSLLAAPFALLQSAIDGVSFILSTPPSAFPWREWTAIMAARGEGAAGGRVAIEVIILQILARILAVYGLHALAVSPFARSVERFVSGQHFSKGKGLKLDFLTNSKLVLLGQLEMVLMGAWKTWMLLMAHQGMGFVTLGLTMWTLFILLKLWSFSTTSYAHRQHKGERLEAITFSNFLYFLFAPTFVYQTSYPRTRSINWDRVPSLIFQLVGVGLVVGCWPSSGCCPCWRPMCTTWLIISTILFCWGLCGWRCPVRLRGCSRWGGRLNL